jgi:TPR repeat protein
MYGICLFHGRGVPIELPKATHYFKLSADQGNDAAQVRYGQCLFHGRGVPVDLQTAANYFKLAADQGTDDAQS